MMKQIIATNKAPGAIGPYSQGTSCDQLVFTSGQLGINPATGKLAGQSVEEQTMQALKNLGEVRSILFMLPTLKRTARPEAALQ